MASGEVLPPVLSHLLITLAVLFQAASSNEGGIAWIQSNEIWLQTGGAARAVVHDAAATDPVVASPDGTRVLYASLNPAFDGISCANTPRQYVILASASGQTLWKASLLEACQEFTRFDWIDQGRVGVMLCGHANCHYWILDSSTGHQVQHMLGGFDYVWSNNRKSVARRYVFMDDADEHSSIGFNDDHPLYPVANAAVHDLPLRDIGEMTWSPDDHWLSFGETEFPSRNSYVVLVNPSGESLRERIPGKIDSASKVVWVDNTHLQMKASGHVFKFVVANGALVESAH